MGMLSLPGRNGCYSRATCNIQMEKDIDEAEILPTEVTEEPGKRIKYCRRCEFACIAGRLSKKK